MFVGTMVVGTLELAKPDPRPCQPWQARSSGSLAHTKPDHKAACRGCHRLTAAAGLTGGRATASDPCWPVHAVPIAGVACRTPDAPRWERHSRRIRVTTAASDPSLRARVRWARAAGCTPCRRPTASTQASRGTAAAYGRRATAPVSSTVIAERLRGFSALLVAGQQRRDRPAASAAGHSDLGRELVSGQPYCSEPPKLLLLALP